MSERRFDGRVAVVTGAGRGLGRSHANLLASLGAKVVVNDLGGSADGDGADPGPAHEVVQEILAAGGTAVPDTNDVSTVEGGAAIVQTALDSFGRIDVLVNNAGMVKFGGFPEVDLANIEKHVAVHLYGSFNTMKAAWPHFVEQDYGRVVLTASTGMYGMKQNLGYAIVKAGMIGFANSATLATAGNNIKINTIFPNGRTRLGGLDDTPEAQAESRRLTDLVAPMVVWMSHEDFPASGQLLVSGGHKFSRIFVAMTQGWVSPDKHPTIDDIADHWDEVCAEDDYYVPTTLMDSVEFFHSHLENHAATTDDDMVQHAHRTLAEARAAK